MDYEKLAQEFEAQQSKTEYPKEETIETELPAVVKTENEIADNSQVSVDANSEIDGKQFGKRRNKKAASSKIDAQKLEAEEEKSYLKVQEQKADNKVRKQKIKNDLIVLRAQAQRLKKEQKQLNKEQKADHKIRSKKVLWELHNDTLTQMKYTSAPNVVVLYVLLFFNGVKRFFGGLSMVSSIILKVLEWAILVGTVFIVHSIAL